MLIGRAAARLGQAALFAPVAALPRLLLAVSGGPDSVALMLLAAAWRDAGATPEFAVATVDHNLRAEAAAEARKVAGWAQALGFAHHLLTQAGEAPKTRVQEWARDMRHARLAQCAADIGAGALLTAHHADDQAETILFRLTRGSGVAGLAGMQPLSRRGGVTLFRPLLDLAKADLVAICEAHGHPFVDDPSNADPRYARARLRHLAPVLAGQGLGRDALLRLGRRAARAEAALAAATQALLARIAISGSAAARHADLWPLAEEADELVLRVLARLIEGQGAAPPLRLDRLEQAAARLHKALRAGHVATATLGGVVLRLDAAGVLTLTPESRRSAAPVHLAARLPP